MTCRFVGTFEGNNVLLDDKEDKAAIDLINHLREKALEQRDKIAKLENDLLSARLRRTKF